MKKMAQKFGNSKIITNFAVLITYKAERKNRKQSVSGIFIP